MKRLMLIPVILGLLGASNPVYAGLDGSSVSCPHCECNCPPDCECHQAGGSCPGDTCIEGCACDSPTEIAQSGPLWIHPEMLKAIADNEKLRSAGHSIDGRGDFIWVNGQKQFTGFRPTSEFYEGVDSINIQVPSDWVMKEIDYSKVSKTKINRQPEGSCWAEGCGTAMNLAWNAPGSRSFIGLAEVIFSVQDVIDCSGYGSARGGGQLSVSYAADKGLALDSVYKYTGHDGRCRKDVERHLPLAKAPMWRGADGKFPTERELNYALNMISPAEACGCAGALGGGGTHTEMPRSCGTNHCYGYGGMRYDAVNKVWLHGIPNSWGESWGDAGWGWYRLAKEPGGKLSGSVLVELQGADTGHVPSLPPEPVDFDVQSKVGLFHVHIDSQDLGAFEPKKLQADLQNEINDAEAM